MKSVVKVTLSLIVLSASLGFGQINGGAFSIAQYLSKAHVNGSLSYWGGEACNFSFSEMYVPVPAVRSPKASGPITEILQEMFADDPNMKVIQEPGGIVRMFETDVPRDLLEIRIRHISFDLPHIHGPNMAVRHILSTPEVESFRKAHKIGPFTEFFRVPNDAGDNNPSVSGSLDNVTVSQALDYIFNELRHGVRPLESESVWYEASESFAEVTRLNADGSLDRRIELWQVFRWNPVFDVRSRPDCVRVVLQVPRYLGCIFSIGDRVKDRLVRQTRRKFAARCESCTENFVTYPAKLESFVFHAMTKAWDYSRMDFVCEVATNKKAVYLNFLFWSQFDFNTLGINHQQRDSNIDRLREAWDFNHIGVPLPVAPPRLT